jgi:hypothetical protein
MNQRGTTCEGNKFKEWREVGGEKSACTRMPAAVHEKVMPLATYFTIMMYDTAQK